MCTIPHTAVLAHCCADQQAAVSPLSLFSAANIEHPGMIVKQLIKEEVRKKVKALFMPILIVHVPFVYTEDREAPHAKHLDSKLPMSNSS